MDLYIDYLYQTEIDELHEEITEIAIEYANGNIALEYCSKAIDTLMDEIDEYKMML